MPQAGTVEGSSRQRPRLDAERSSGAAGAPRHSRHTPHTPHTPRPPPPTAPTATPRTASPAQAREGSGGRACAGAAAGGGEVRTESLSDGISVPGHLVLRGCCYRPWVNALQEQTARIHTGWNRASDSI